MIKRILFLFFTFPHDRSFYLFLIPLFVLTNSYFYFLIFFFALPRLEDFQERGSNDFLLLLFLIEFIAKKKFIKMSILYIEKE